MLEGIIDIEHETVLPLSLAARHPMLRQGRREGRPVSRATLERWHRRGIRGVKLPTVLVGALRVTTVEALNRFFEQLERRVRGLRRARPKFGLHLNAEAELTAVGL